MIDGIDVCIGGLDICSDLNKVHVFRYPENQPISYLLDGHLCAALVLSLSVACNISQAAPAGGTSVTISFQQATMAIDHLRHSGAVTPTQIQTLASLVDRWRLIPHAALSIWWNKTPYAFDVLPICNPAVAAAL